MKSSKAETQSEPEVAIPNNLRKEASWRTQEAKARARREAKFGPTTPLVVLAGVEEELHCQSKARDALSSEAPRGNRNALRHGVFTKEELDRRALLRGLIKEATKLLEDH